MTALLEKAFAEASQLPKAAQIRLAKQLLVDIADETEWEETLDASQPLLERLAREARRAKQDGKTVKKGFDEL